MALQQDSCCLEHGFSENFTVGRVLKARERLLTKIFFLLWSTLSRDLFPPALFSKTAGIIVFTFTSTDVEERRSGQHAMGRFSHRLRRALILFTEVFTIKLERVLTPCPVWKPPIFVASDVRLDIAKEPSIGIPLSTRKSHFSLP